MSRVLCGLTFSLVMAASGCGGPEPATVKETLTEKEKQQVQDLNKQRQSEWSNTPKQK